MEIIEVNLIFGGMFMGRKTNRVLKADPKILETINEDNKYLIDSK